LAKQQAKRDIQHLIRAKGQRISDYSCRELSLMAEQYLSEHLDELMPRARTLAEEILRNR